MTSCDFFRSASVVIKPLPALVHMCTTSVIGETATFSGNIKAVVLVCQKLSVHTLFTPDGLSLNLSYCIRNNMSQRTITVGEGSSGDNKSEDSAECWRQWRKSYSPGPWRPRWSRSLSTKCPITPRVASNRTLLSYHFPVKTSPSALDPTETLCCCALQYS